MQKLTAGALAAALLCVTYAATAGSGDDRMPDANAYVSLGFGGPKHAAAPLAYGFQFGDTSQSSVRQQIEARFGGDREWHAPLLRVDFTGGLHTARIDGLPLFKQQLKLNEDGSSGGWFSDWTALDWGLVAVGAIGVGVVASQAFKSKDSSQSSSTTTGGTTGGTTGTTTGGLLGGLLGGTSGGTTTGGLLGGLLGGTSGGSTTGTTTGGLLGGLLGGTSGGSTTGTTTGGLLGGLLGGGFTAVDGQSERERDIEYQRYLDGGTGQMGDLGG